MLQNKHFDGKNYDVQSIKDEAQRRAVKYLQEDEFPKYVSICVIHVSINVNPKKKNKIE